jgi:uncharacterized protein YdeI (YjbR/CyaY-like superfamily)
VRSEAAAIIGAMDPIFFETAAGFRKWLEKNHDSETELWVGFRKKASGLPSITYPEAVDQALCFGWIDGIRKSVDDTSYTNRFTPRKSRSNWSAVNIKRVGELIEAGAMHPAGLAAFEERSVARSAVYSYEQRHLARLDAAHEKRFRAKKRAWDFFQSQPPSYRQTAIYWVVSAKKTETREKRLTQLIDDSAKGRRIGPMARPPRNR